MLTLVAKHNVYFHSTAPSNSDKQPRCHIYQGEEKLILPSKAQFVFPAADCERTSCPHVRAKMHFLPCRLTLVYRCQLMVGVPQGGAVPQRKA